MQACDANQEVPHPEFVDLVKKLLKNPDEREHFFQVSVTVLPQIWSVYENKNEVLKGHPDSWFKGLVCRM